MQKIKTGELYNIGWLDHTGFFANRWRDEKQAIEELEPTMVHSVGWVLYQTDEYVLQAGTMGDEGDVKHEHAIIKSCIRKVKKLDG